MAVTKASARRAEVAPKPTRSGPRADPTKVGEVSVTRAAPVTAAQPDRSGVAAARSTPRRVTILNHRTGRSTARTFSDLYRTDVLDRIGIIKGGLPATAVKDLAHDMDIASERLTTVLGVAPATINRKVRAGATLDVDESTRVLGMVRLVGQVEQMALDAGSADGFDAARWVAQWIERPVPALGNAKPADFMDTAVGQGLICDLVAKMQSGAYA